MKGSPLFFCLFAVMSAMGMTSPVTADMKSLTDGQMGAVQGNRGTIVSANVAAPGNLVSTHSPGRDRSTGLTLVDGERTVSSPGSLTTDIHPGSSSPDVLFSIHMNVDRVTYRTNNTRMVEGWSGNRVDFQSRYANQ